MSNQIKPHKSNKEKCLVFNNSSKEFSKSLTNKKHADLFRDNKSLKIHPNKLISRSNSKQITKENIVKQNNDIKKSNNEKDKNIFKSKEKHFKDRKDEKSSPNYSSSPSSKTKSHKTDDKCESKHRNSSDSKTNCTENKISRSKIKETLPTSKDEKKHSNEINSRTCSNTDKFNNNHDIYKPKKIADRRKSYHHEEKIPHNDEEKESTFKRRNSHASSKITCLESDKKLNILQTNKQLSVNSSQLRKRSTSSDVQSDKENLTKHTLEKKIKFSQNSTKTTDSNKDTNNEYTVCKITDTIESRKRSNSEFSLFDYEVDSTSESKRPKTTDKNSPGFSAFSSLNDIEVITIDKTQILPPINDSNSPYVSFGDFLNKQSIPLIESSPKAPEFSCTQLEGDKLLIKKRNLDKNTIVIDITDEDDEPNNNNNNNNTESSKITPKKDCDVKIKTNVEEKFKNDEDSSDSSNKEKRHVVTENSSKITPKKEFDVKIENCDNITSVGGSLANSQKSSSDSIYKQKTQKECDVKIIKTNRASVESLDNSHTSSSDSINNGKKKKATENSTIISPKKDCDVKTKHSIETDVVSLDNSHERSSDFINNGNKHKATENTSIISPKKDCDIKIKRSDNKTNFGESVNNSHESLSNKRKTKKTNNRTRVVESLDNSHENSSDSTKKRKVPTATEKSERVVEGLDMNNETSFDAINNRKKEICKDESIVLTESYKKNETKENLKGNSKSDKPILQKFEILFTDQAVQFITSDLVSVLRVYVAFKKFGSSKSNENEEVNNKDHYINRRSTFLKSLCKKLLNAKVHNFKIPLFFDSLIESIKIHIAPEEILNEKTISRFIHNVLFLFMENCSSPDDHYILYNHVVSLKSLQYLDQKLFSLSGSVDKQIFDCMNSFSVKLERSKDSSILRQKNNEPPLLFIDNSPDKITDVTPGNSLPCINTGENLVEKISPIRSSEIDMIPQISIVDTSNKNDNMEENLIDILLNLPTHANFKNNVVQSSIVEKNTSNQSKIAEHTDKDAVIESIESKLNALFNEKFPVQKTNINVEKSQETNCDTSVLYSDEIMSKPVPVRPTEILDSLNSDSSNSMNFLKNINPNKSYLVSTDKNLITNTPSSVSLQALFDNVTSSVRVTPTSTPTAKTNNDDRNIKIINDIVVTPAISLKPQSNPITLENVNTIQETNKSTKRIETEETNSFSVNSSSMQNVTPPNKLLKTFGTEGKDKVTKRPYVRRKPLSERKKRTRSSNTIDSQSPKDSSQVKDITILPKPFPTSNISNNPLIPTVVAERMKNQLNKDNAKASPNSSSYMMNQIPQKSNSLPKSTAASMQLQPTTPLNFLQQFCNPIQVQQTLYSIQQSHLQPQTNPVPLTRQLSAPSHLQQPLPAATITQSILPSQSSSAMPPLPELPPPPPPPIISHQPYLPNKSTLEPVYQSSYTSSLNAAHSFNLQSSNPHEEITRQVTLKQVVERTLVQEYKTQTVHTQQPPNYSYKRHMYEKHLEELKRQEFRQQQVEQIRQKELQLQQHQELLKLQKKQEMERQQQIHERIRHQQRQEMLKYQQEQEMMHSNMYFYNYNNNNNNMTTMYNSNNYYNVQTGQVPQYKPNEYTYPTYHSGYPAISDNLMPQLINNGNGGAHNYLTNQQTTQNEIGRNTVPIGPTSAQRKNNNLIYPPITYPHASLYGERNLNSHQNSTASNYLRQAAINQNDRNPNNTTMQNNTVSSVSHTSVIVTNSVTNTTRSSSHQVDNGQLMRAGAAVPYTSQNHTILRKQNETHKTTTNNTLEQDLNELEELLNNDTDTRGAKEMDSAVRNSSRDSGYMTPTRQKDETCGYCLGVGNFVCSGCVHVYYCSEECQTEAWPSHQKVCFL